MEGADIRLKKEFIKDMKSNYLVLKGEGSERSYKNKMLAQYTIPGLLRTEIRSIDNIELYYYDITDLKTVEAICRDRIFHFSEVKDLLEGIFQTIDSSQEYFLEQDDFILHPEYLYVKEGLESLQLCYFPGYGENIVNQLAVLFEAIMNKADYKEEPLVLLIYALYKESREKNTTLYKLKDILKAYNHPEIKVKKILPQDVKSLESEAAAGQEVNNFVKSSVLQKTNILDKSNILTKSDSLLKSNSLLKPNTIMKPNIFPKSNSISKPNAFPKSDSISKSNALPKSNALLKSNTLLKTNILKRETDSQLKERKEKAEAEVNLSGEYEKQEEVSYYEIQTYIIAGAVVAVGIGVSIILYKSGVLSNQMGEPDIVKVAAGIAVIVCLVGYVFSKLFDPKMKSTRMVTKVVYEEEQEKKGEGNSIRENRSFNPGKEERFNKANGRENYLEENYAGENNTSENYRRENHAEENHTGENYTGKNYVSENYRRENYVRENCERGYAVKENSIKESGRKENEMIDEEGEYVTQLLAEEDKTEILYAKAAEPSYCLVAKNKENPIDIPIKSFPFYIGKDKNRNQLILKESSVSRLHAVVTIREEEVFLTDIGSTNGTFVNGQKLEKNHPTLINNSDELAFSREVFLFKVKEF
ncbi:DUF6382 domain-containing protein [Anaerocolumna jejuensis]|uniref:DUF6382 domain-containing protein n=1 Tax=Anaerocolumna jejuensis TaxID=259063 RepID=UPI003F7BCC96